MKTYYTIKRYNYNSTRTQFTEETLTELHYFAIATNKPKKFQKLTDALIYPNTNHCKNPDQRDWFIEGPRQGFYKFK